MVKYIGCTDILGFCLKYYVYGSFRRGYGIRITEAGSYEDASLFISRSLCKTLALARVLHRCCVFPCSLGEIVEDLRFEAEPVDKPEPGIL